MLASFMSRRFRASGLKYLQRSVQASILQTFRLGLSLIWTAPFKGSLVED